MYGSSGPNTGSNSGGGRIKKVQKIVVDFFDMGWNFVSYSQRDLLEDKNQDALDKVKIRMCAWKGQKLESMLLILVPNSEGRIVKTRGLSFYSPNSADF